MGCPETGTAESGDFMSEVSELPRTDAQRWGLPWVPGAARSGESDLGGEAEGASPALGREGCVQPSVLAEQGWARGARQQRAEGSFLPTGEEKQIHFSAFQRKGVSFFFFF